MGNTTTVGEGEGMGWVGNITVGEGEGLGWVGWLIFFLR